MTGFLEAADWIIVVGALGSVKIAEQDDMILVGLKALNVLGQIVPEALSGAGGKVALGAEEMPLLRKTGCESTIVD